MCGHFGIIYKGLNGMFQKHVNMFKEGLYVDALRGDDATGVCMVDNDGSATIVKAAQEASWFMLADDFNKLTTRAIKSGKVLMGHNRKATIGHSGDSNNSHPFIVNDDMVFFHNGSLYNWHKWGYNTDVDSESLGQHIYNSKDLGEALSDVSGAYAVAWYDATKEQVNIVRNSERPMFIAELSDCYIYASDQFMIALVASRANEKVKEFKELPIDTLCTFDLRKQFQDFKPEYKELTVKKATPPTLMRTGAGQGTGASANSFRYPRGKRQFKAWSKKVIGETITVRAEDFTKIKGSNGPCVWLDCSLIDEYDPNVAIHAFVNCEEREALDKYYQRIIDARIDYVSLENNGQITIYIDNLQVHNENQACI